MQRLYTAIQRCEVDQSVRVVLDVNPNHFENRNYIDSIFPGEARSHERIKEYFRGRGVHYFAVDGINDANDLQAVVFDYVSNNTHPGDRFVMMFDRTPSNLNELLGSYSASLAGFYV